jgi:hypothetical protein
VSGVSVVLADPRTPYADRIEPLLQGLRALRKVVMMIVYRGKRALAMQVRKTLQKLWVAVRYAGRS